MRDAFTSASTSAMRDTFRSMQGQGTTSARSMQGEGTSKAPHIATAMRGTAMQGQVTTCTARQGTTGAATVSAAGQGTTCSATSSATSTLRQGAARLCLATSTKHELATAAATALAPQRLCNP